MEGPRRRSTRLLASGGGPDLISELPDELLLLILACLHCAAAAVRTGVLSRRWRGLWHRLGQIFLSDVPFRSIESALGSFPVPPPAVSLIHIRILGTQHQLRARVRWTDTANAASLLCAAARLEPEEFVFELARCLMNPSLVVELPCFHRASSIVLALRCHIVPRFPAGIEFTALETLSLSHCRADIERLLSCCPRLRTLRLNHIDFHRTTAKSQTVSLNALEEVWLNVFGPDDHELNFLKLIYRCAPMLKKMTMYGASSRKKIYNILEDYPSVEVYVSTLLSIALD